jgi:uncharacterized membrane protein
LARFFLGEASESQVKELTWASPIPAWVLFLLVMPLVVCFVAVIYRRERLAGALSRFRWLFGGLRALLFLAIVAMLAQPVLRTTKYQNQDSSLLLVVDDSLSMDIADKYSNRELVQKLADFFSAAPEMIESTKRYDLVRRLFRDKELGLLEKLRKKAKLSLFSFAGALRRLKEVPRFKDGDSPLSDEEREILPPYDTIRADQRVLETRIADALLDAVASVRGGTFGGAEQRVSGILLFSDGQQTPGSRPLPDVARRLGQRNIPIYAFGVGNPDDPKDIRVLSLDVNDIVLAGDRVPFDVSVVADGFENERVRVDLKFQNEIVDTQYVQLEGGGRRQAVRLEYRPPKPGDFVATVEVEHRTGELFSENNAVSKPIKVLDQKIKVLYADGLPRWEYRYLKNALIRDTTMQAQVYLFSADPNFIQESSPGVPPLQRFPQNREELFSYHVIILGDVDVERALTAEQISLFKDFVYEGGGLVFISGDNANPSKYLHTDLYAILPVEVPERQAFPLGDAPNTTPFNVELTPAGKEHTVLRLDNDLERNVKLWENKDGKLFEHLPGFLSFADVGRAKKGAVLLARHPTKMHPIDQKGLPAFVFMNYGKGRTFFSAVDDTWRWRAGVDNQYFYRFWGQVIRFSATGRLLGKTPRFSITTDKLSYTLGETVSIECRVLDANMKPSTERTLTVYHQSKGEEGRSPERLELELDPQEAQGTYHGGILASRLGLHDLWLGSETERQAFRTFEVLVPALELRDPRRNRTALEEAALLSNGGYFELQDLPQVIDKLEGESRTQQGDVEDDPVWDDSWVLLLFTALITLEWILRKVANLL